jgi:hypothetical protein
MSKKQLKLSIPTPCHEDWNTMTATQSGKFCASCQKTVIDFSLMSDAEIIHYFSDFKGETCGRLTEKQLNSVIAEPLVLKPNYRWAYALSALLLPTVAASQTVKNSVPTEIRDPLVFEAKNDENVSTIEIKLKGVIIDIHGQPLVGASIHLKGTKLGAIAGIEGNFHLEFSSKQIDNTTFEIEAIYPGFDTFSLKINLAQIPDELKILLKESPFESVTVVGYQYMGKVCISRSYEDEKLRKELSLLKVPYEFADIPTNAIQRTKYRIKRFFRKKKRD